MSFKLLFNSDRYDSKRSLVRNRHKTRTLFSLFFSLILDKLTNFWNKNNIILFLSVILILNIVKIIYYRSKVKKTKRKDQEKVFNEFNIILMRSIFVLILRLKDTYVVWSLSLYGPQLRLTDFVVGEAGRKKTADVIGVSHQKFDIRRTNTNFKNY